MKKLDGDINLFSRKNNSNKNEKEFEDGNTEMMLD
jgi:hypothetical protein